MNIHIYTDGSCLGNPGPGAWAFRIESEEGNLLQTGEEAYALTTNNRMEMMAVIEAFRHLEAEGRAGDFHVYSDSSLIIQTMTQGWKKKQNKDLWAILEALVQGKKVTWHWVRGHNGHAQNEDCDVRARRAAMADPKTMQKDEVFERSQAEEPSQGALF